MTNVELIRSRLKAKMGWLFSEVGRARREGAAQCKVVICHSSFVTRHSLWRLRYWAWAGIWDAVRLGLKSDITTSLFWLPMGLLIYGLFLLLPMPSFSPAVRLLDFVVPESVLGLFFAIVGRCGLHALTDDNHLLCATSRWVFFCFTCLFLASLLTNWASLGVPVFGLTMLRSLWVNQRICGQRLNHG